MWAAMTDQNISHCMHVQADLMLAYLTIFRDFHPFWILLSYTRGCKTTRISIHISQPLKIPVVFPVGTCHVVGFAVTRLIRFDGL